MDETFIIGADIGQRFDYTALIAVSRLPLVVPVGEKKTWYAIRHVDRFRQVKYGGVGRRLKALAGMLSPSPPIVLDVTGVGRGVLDNLAEIQVPNIVPVTITGGDAVTREAGEYRVPKRDLVSVVAILLENERLKIGPEVPHAELLMRELQNFRCKISASGHDSYAAGSGLDWREGAHDDLVLGLALAVWYGETIEGEPGASGTLSGTPAVFAAGLAHDPFGPSARSGWDE